MLSNVLSYAKSGAVYKEDQLCQGFRARKVEDGNVRIHIARELIRTRPTYVALDIPLKSFRAVASLGHKTGSKKATKAVKTTKKVAKKAKKGKK